MDLSIKRLACQLAAISGLFGAANIFALDTTVTLQADTAITPNASEVVTFGLPLAEGEVVDLSEIKVTQGATELPVSVQAGMRWHWSDNSYRSVTIQLQNVDMTGGNILLRITDEGRSTTDLTPVPQSNGWTAAGADKANMPYPRIFAMHDPFYLDDTGIIPPYNAAPETPDSFELFQQAQVNNWSGGLDYNASSGANWLFDRSTAYFKLYMTTGEVKYLKEAILSKQFYFSHVRDDGSTPAPAGGEGCWTYGVACADGKYIAPQQAKLAWALVGDNSQWDEQLIVNMALQSDLGWNQYGTRDPFDSQNEGFTERGAGMAGLAEIVAYEMTGNQTMLDHLNERIASLKDMQQTEKPWDLTNGWVPKSGGFTHNIDVHEGNCNESSCPLNDSTSRGFSAWMSENIVDFLWQTYWVTKNEDIPEMLRLVAHAVDDYGFTSAYSGGDHVTKPEFSGQNPRTQGCNTTKEDTDLLYMASAHAPVSSRTSGDWWPWYSDNHNIETVLVLGTGYYFETDEVKKMKLRARIEKLIQGWGHTGCAGVFSGVYRLFNWQHRSNSVRTWQWVDETIPAPVGGTSSSSSSSSGSSTSTSSGSGGTGGGTSSSSSSSSSSSGGATVDNPPSAPGIMAVVVKSSPTSSSSSSTSSSSSGTTSTSSSTSSSSSSSSTSSSSGGVTGVTGVGFAAVTKTAFDNSPSMTRAFWAGMPDVNGDGCLDIYIGSHSDDDDSNMLIQNNVGGTCQGTFTYFPDNDNYSQATPVTPRITSRYTWGNWYGHPQGFWSFYGNDVDGSASGRYVIDPSFTSVGGQPQYQRKTTGCFGERPKCIIADIDGDNAFEMVSRLFSAPYNTGYVVDLVTGETKYASPVKNNTFTDGLIVFDVDNDGAPEIIHALEGGYWKFNKTSKALEWMADTIPAGPTKTTDTSSMVFDYDSDGDADFLFIVGMYDVNGTATPWMYRNNGDGTFTNVTATAFNNITLSNTAYFTTYSNSAIADINLDGYPDVVFGGQGFNEAVTLLMNNGDGSFTEDVSIDFTPKNFGWDARKPWLGVGDYDNDGRIDIVHTGNGPDFQESASTLMEGQLFRNVTDNGNHWLRVRVKGNGANTDGLHSRITLFVPGTSNVITSYQVGVFTGGYQNLITHVGLGDNTRVDLQVDLPHGGSSCRHPNITVDRDVVVLANCQLVDYQPGSAIPLSQ